ncbi:MAG: hypothetical protein PHV34_11205 [Verrucomicrobiae bacterium]|nr:hypothetical protein [Verrucomicrobiae bacterium]
MHRALVSPKCRHERGEGGSSIERQALVSPKRLGEGGSSCRPAAAGARLNSRVYGSRFTVFLAVGLALALLGCGRKNDSAGFWKDSVVVVEINRKHYDYFQPWSRRNETFLKGGVVIGGREILTTADRLQDRTLVRVRKHGRGQWWNAKVKWLDYHANMALLTVDDPVFWHGTKTARLADLSRDESSVRVRMWKDGNLEDWQAEVSKVAVGQGEMSFSCHVVLELTSNVSNAGWSEIITRDDRLVGLASSHEGNMLRVLPASVIRSVLDAQRKGAFQGLSYFPFYWQPGENAANLRYLGQTGGPSGVIVTQIPAWPPHEDGLKQHDVILNVDGFEVDDKGDYDDPTYGYLMFENLPNRNHVAGDRLKMTVLRNGRQEQISYRLPPVDYRANLVPMAAFDQEPDYLIAGGLVFQPLVLPYLKGWGEEWAQRAPFRLVYCTHEDPAKERPSLVFLSQVLPDAYNRGYQDYRFLIVDKVNGKSVSRVEDVARALKSPMGDFHIVDFMQTKAFRRLVLDASSLQEATGRVLARYGIPKDHSFVSETRR